MGGGMRDAGEMRGRQGRDTSRRRKIKRGERRGERESAGKHRIGATREERAGQGRAGQGKSGPSDG
eukprot:756486-Hanusia_phi.AAC.2